MPNITNKLNKVFRVLMGTDGATTQTGQDLEYLDSSLADIMTIDNTRLAKYKDFIWMDDNYGQEITASLDSVADMVMRIDEPLDEVILVKSDFEKTARFVKDLYVYLNLRNWLWSYARSLAKFGDLFAEIIWAKDGRNRNLSHIVGLKVLPARTIFLNVKDGVIDKKLPYRQEFDGNPVAYFKPWQMIHFRLPREPTDDYGTSWLKPARLPHRQLLAMENALVIARIKKTNIRVHRVDVTGKHGDLQKDALKEYKAQFKRKLWKNPTSGALERHKTPVMSNDDIYMGVTKDGGKFSGIELLEGKSEIDISDILYTREKLMTALKTPKHRININDVGASNKLVSNDQAMYFSASIQRVQMALIEGLRFMTDLGLLVKGVDINSRGKDYTLALPKQRTTDELIAARVELIKSTVAKNYSEMGLFSTEEIMRSILKWDADRIARVQKELAKPNAQNGGNGNGNGGNGKVKDKNFNKTGTGSAPIRKPQKEDIKKVLENEDIKELVNDVSELLRNKRVFNNKNFLDMDYIKSELKKKQ